MVPYGVLALGKVHRLLKNYGEARGFLKVISDNYSDFPGVPESLLEMARIHMETDKISLAVAVLEQLISHYPNSPFVTEARLDLGKALFEANNFQGAIEHFKAVVKSSPWMVYQSADLLVCLGNSYYQMGQFAEAGKILLQAINIFPEIPSNHTVLTRIGDIFREGKQPEKAQKIYEHVVKNFPGSDGFIISSVRIAESLKRRAEKENLFQMIIKDFPDHPLTQLAYVKLAHLFNAEGDHEKSIETIHAFVAKYPGALKKEAISVMENAYGALFRKLITADDPAGVITWYERDKAIVNRINSPDIYFMAGQGYFQGHLYEEAANLFERAGRLFDKQKRPAELFFKLGISLQESGKTDAALNALVGYTRTDPQPVHAAEANVRIGQILMDKKKYKDALVRFKAAYPHTREKSDQAAIRIREAEANKALGDPAAAARHLIQAIDLLAALPDQPDMTLCRLYRDLGETYVTVKDYLKAADAFAMAIKFTDGGHAPDLRFLLAETYEKGRAVDQAGKVYQEIIALGDPFWARLAQEKLKGIQIDKQLAPAATVNG